LPNKAPAFRVFQDVVTDDELARKCSLMVSAYTSGKGDDVTKREVKSKKFQQKNISESTFCALYHISPGQSPRWAPYVRAYTIGKAACLDVVVEADLRHDDCVVPFSAETIERRSFALYAGA
jgi:hypothetical protein